jgi:hypothetical protein
MTSACCPLHFFSSVWHTRSQQENSVFFQGKENPALYWKLAAKSAVFTKNVFSKYEIFFKKHNTDITLMLNLRSEQD